MDRTLAMMLVDRRFYQLGPPCHHTKGFCRKGEKTEQPAVRLCAGQGAQQQGVFLLFSQTHNGFPTSWGWLLEFFLDRQVIFL